MSRIFDQCRKFEFLKYMCLHKEVGKGYPSNQEHLVFIHAARSSNSHYQCLQAQNYFWSTRYQVLLVPV